jgi:hypothetical protein
LAVLILDPVATYGQDPPGRVAGKFQAIFDIPYSYVNHILEGTDKMNGEPRPEGVCGNMVGLEFDTSIEDGSVIS